MKTALSYGLLLSILMVIAPHAAHLPPWVNTLCAALLMWRGYLAYSGHPLPGRWLLITLSLTGMAGILVEYHTLFGREAGVTMLVLLASLKLMELRTRRDAMALIYLSCFILLTHFLYSQSLTTALTMLATLLVIVTTWVHLHAPGSAFKPRLRIAAVLLLQAVPLTVMLFVLFPRVQGPLWGLPNDAFASSGLDDQMSPGSMARLALSDAVAFRVNYRDAPPQHSQMYWRGPVLWNYDGRTWTAGQTQPGIAPQFSDTGQTLDYTVTLEPHNKTWLFMLDAPDKISVPASLTADFQVLSPTPIHARLRYEARSRLIYHAQLQESARQLQRALQLPHPRNPRTRQLAASWRAANTTDAGVIRSALAHFNQQNFRYTLEPPPLPGRDGIDDFLFTTRQGFCEHYASAFVFLMRAAGIPARVVTGYQGGEYNAYGNYYIVRQSDAHAWAEVWLKDQGWLRIDPTAAIAPERVEHGLSAALPDNSALPFLSRDPPRWLRDLRLNLDTLTNRWNQWVIGYSGERQFAFLSRLGMASLSWQQLAISMMTGIGLLIALYALFMLRHLFTRKADKTQTAWLNICQKLARAGLPRKPHEGPKDYAMRVSAARPELANTLEDLAARYCLLRYGRVQDEHAQGEFMRRAANFRSGAAML